MEKSVTFKKKNKQTKLGPLCKCPTVLPKTPSKIRCSWSEKNLCEIVGPTAGKKKILAY